MDGFAHLQLAVNRAEAALGAEVLTAPPELETQLDAAPPDTNDAEPEAHLVDKDELIAAAFAGKVITAWCGKRFVPKLFNPDKPLCQACLNVLKNGGPAGPGTPAA